MRISPSRLVRAPRRPVILGVAAIGVLAAGACSEQAAAVRVEDAHVSHADFMDQVDELDAMVNGMQPATGGAEAGTTSPNRYEQEFVGGVATDWALHEVRRQLFEESGRELATADAELLCAATAETGLNSRDLYLFETGGDGQPPDEYRDDVFQTVGATRQQLDAGGAAVPDWFCERAVNSVIMDMALTWDQAVDVLGTDDYEAVRGCLNDQSCLPSNYLVEEVDDFDIEISSRYGTWDGERLRDPNSLSTVAPPAGPLIQRDDDGPEIGPGDPGTGAVDPDQLPEDAVVEEVPAGP